MILLAWFRSILGFTVSAVTEFAKKHSNRRVDSPI
jgi:hypothetical protein